MADTEMKEADTFQYALDKGRWAGYTVVVFLERLCDYTSATRSNNYKPIKVELIAPGAAEDDGIPTPFHWVKDTECFQEDTELAQAYSFQAQTWRIMADCSEPEDSLEFKAFSGIEAIVTPDDTVLTNESMVLKDAADLPVNKIHFYFCSAYSTKIHD